MYSADRRKLHSSDEPKEITKKTADELLSLPNYLAIAFDNTASLSLMAFDKYIAYDIYTRETTDRYMNECEAISNLLDGESYITVPYRQKGIAAGRIFLVAGNKSFNQSDVAFAMQVADAMSSVVENMQMIEDLIEDAGGHERHRISLDVHDTTIQPYIGLTLALSALSREFSSDPLLTNKIDEIIHMANMTIQDLRSYKDTLREKSLMRGDFLVTAISHQADRLFRFYGIHVDVIDTIDPNLSGKIAEAAFQIVKEGLSNILRHTDAKKAFVSIQSSDTHLILEIGNDTENSTPSFELFKPKSIFERASTLNGETIVTTNNDGYSVVRVTIPLIKE
jgi:signal transduction histidine kinase